MHISLQVPQSGTTKPALWTLDWTMDWTVVWTSNDHFQFLWGLGQGQCIEVSTEWSQNFKNSTMKVSVSLLQCVQTIECDWSCRMVYTHQCCESVSIGYNSEMLPVYMHSSIASSAVGCQSVQYCMICSAIAHCHIHCNPGDLVYHYFLKIDLLHIYTGHRLSLKLKTTSRYPI